MQVWGLQLIERPEVDKSYREALVEITNADMGKHRRSPGNVAPADLIWKIIDENEVVFAIWPDETKPRNVGWRCVKGIDRLGEIVITGKVSTMRTSAISCKGEAQAVALEEACKGRGTGIN